MTEQELRSTLTKAYNRENWKQVLLKMFPESELFAQDRPTVFTREEQRNLANHIVHFGEVSLNGDTLIFLEVELKPDSVQLSQNRVGLRRLVDNEVISGLNDAAIISYYQPETDDWRITFYSEMFDWDEDGNPIKRKTNPKRYTFVVGPTESCRTASTRLYEILKVNKSHRNTVKTVKEAFSVEKVSKKFFRQYKEQYDKFVGYLTGEVWSGGKEPDPVETSFTQLQCFFGHATDPKKEARDFVKKLLGRIVFLYFIQKKKWIGSNTPDFKDGDPNFLSNLFHSLPDSQKYSFYSSWLEPLFFDTLNEDEDHTFTMPNGEVVYIPFLNGGLFEKDETDKKASGLSLPQELFSNPNPALREKENEWGFLDFLNAYNFTVHEDSPGDHTIAVDPEMLGHIFENLLEDNKDKGAYYTPKPIVHYMCQESIIEYLLTSLTDDKTKGKAKESLRDDLEDLVKNQNVGQLSGKTKEILKALHSVKVCDPAIGSGAFPMGILQEIFQIVDTFHFYESDEFYEGWNLEQGEWKPAEVKKQIIQNSIYGVDIEKGAVDIARLRFWLSLIVDEEDPTPLPNLDYKIMIGDSLVSRLMIDGEEQIVKINWEMKGEVGSTKEHLKNLKSTLSTIVEKQKKYFDANIEKKAGLKNEIDQLKVEALIHQLHFDREDYVANNEDNGNFFEENTERKLKLIGFNELIKKLETKKNDLDSIEFFDWKLDFPKILNEKISKKTGFDIVIANPPYLGESGNKEKFRRVTQGGLSDFYLGKMDYFYFFMHLALNLSNENGVNTFITTNYYPTADGALKLRKDLKERSNIIQLINFGELKVFDSARGQHNLITIFKKPSEKRTYVQIMDVKKSGTATSDDLNKILNSEDGQTKYQSFKSNELYDGTKNYIRLSGTVTSSGTGVNSILEKVSVKADELLGSITEINQGVVSGCDKFTNRFTDKVQSLSNIEINDGIYVFDLENARDLQTIHSFNYDEKKLLKPFFKNSDIYKYKSDTENNKLLLYLDRDISSIDKYPNIERHLLKFEDVLKDRREYKNGRIEYFQLQWPRDENIFRSPKICVPYRVRTNCFAYNDIDWYCRSDCYLITGKNDDEGIALKYILALLNSSLFFFWLYHRGKRKGETLELFYTPLSEIPIYLAPIDIQAELIKKVEDIERAKEKGKKAETLEKEIDTLVYKLYNLTWEEVNVVDPEFGLSEEEYERVEVEMN